ncbi:hypothetical protein PJF56_01380 [Roseofilum sp. BLCC_M91]|uniref:Uncharacterized protein n=1 Tax=Roseofilum halophilum BLCC-M91 TaxID=3022259 RepID=A0ABT7BEA9_9CYAN|nr:hypothetical protein [Roseofilum halophilum]MDJ1177506.1 hypothetical protein [Roseofilum halophilum BLCC-M91]
MVFAVLSLSIKKQLARITRQMRRGQTLSDTLQGIFPIVCIRGMFVLLNATNPSPF